MPASKPAVGAVLDADNPYGITVAVLLNEGEGGWAGDCGPAGLNGTLEGTDLYYEFTVSGGTGGNAVYNQTYAPGGAYPGYPGKVKYVSADGNYWCVYDDMSMAWALMPANGDPMMDAVDYNDTAISPWSGSWYSFTVNSGNAWSPWQADGVRVFAGVGSYINIPNTGDALDLGTGDFSLLIKCKAGPGVGVSNEAGQVAQLITLLGGMRIGIDQAQPWGGTFNFAVNGDSNRAVFASSTGVYSDRANHVIAITCDRDGNASLTCDGSAVAQSDMSALSGVDLSTGDIQLGVRYPNDLNNQGWCWDGWIDTFYLAPGVVWTPAQAQALTADPWMETLFESASSDLETTAGVAEAVAEGLGAGGALDDELSATAGIAEAVAEGLGASAELGTADLEATARIAEAVAEGLAAAGALDDELSATAGIAEAVAEGLDAGAALGDELGGTAGIAEAVAEGLAAGVASGLDLESTAGIAEATAEGLAASGALGDELSGTAGIAEAEAEGLGARGTVPVALAEIDGILTDIAEMSDGSVWIGVRDGDGPFLRIADKARTEICRNHGRVMSRMSCTVEALAGPETADGVVALHPDGWALAVRDDAIVGAGLTLMLWQYSGGTWTVAAEGLEDAVPVIENGYGYTLVTYRGEIYVVAMGLTLYRHRGASLVQSPLAGEMGDLVDIGFVGSEQHSYVPGRMAADWWRGRWTGVTAAEGASNVLGYWDGQAMRTLCALEERPQRVIGSGTDLHLFGAWNLWPGEAQMGTSWSCMRSGRLVRTRAFWGNVVSGHATGGRVWLVMYHGLWGYGVNVIQEAGALAPALLEIRQSGGSDATAPSPALLEMRQYGRARALATLGLLEMRQAAGSSAAAASPRLLEMRQTAGRDAAAASPALLEMRQGAGAALPASPRLLEMRQGATSSAGPGVGEHIRFYVRETSGQATGVIVDSNDSQADQAGLRAIARGDDEGLAVDAYDTYQPVRMGMRTELQRPGQTVRVGIIKTVTAPVPDVGITANSHEE